MPEQCTHSHVDVYFNPVDSYLITSVTFLADQRQAINIRVKMHHALRLHLGKKQSKNRSIQENFQ